MGYLLLPREWAQDIAYGSFGSWPFKPSQQCVRGHVWVYLLCLCFLSHRSLNSCSWIVYLGQRYVGSVKGKSHSKQFLSVVCILYRRSERQWFLYSKSFNSPMTLVLSGPGLPVTPALFFINPYPTWWCTFWAVSRRQHLVEAWHTMYPSCAFSHNQWKEFRPMAKN